MHNLKPKKQLGQHFLKDPLHARKIADCLRASDQDQVVEIGPGQGIMTDQLWPQFPHLHLVEVDPDAVAWLQNHFGDSCPKIIHQDVLKWQPEEHLNPNAFFIGNLPYNISSPIFFALLERMEYMQEGVFMIQKEVAQRICSPEGNKTYGILSVLIGAYYEREYMFSVKPGAFRPPPKVMSGVIRLTRKTDLPDLPFAQLKKVVKQAFGKRRKTLRNALKGLDFQAFPELDAWYTQRAEQLTIDQFIRLSQHLK